jgi:glycosyltransferase involved in cell wall biosynthesis
MTSISVITPTIGRPSLERMLVSLLPQLSENDEVLVVGDGPQPEAERIISKLLGSSKKPVSTVVRYWETKPVRNFGNPQRNEAVGKAVCKRLFFVDDDDVVLPGAIAAIRARSKAAPASPLMFRMQHPAVIMWNEKKVLPGNVSGQMFVVPNIKDRLGVWSGRYEADQDFISSTLALYQGGVDSVVWCPEVLAIQGLAGKAGAGGVEL